MAQKKTILAVVTSDIEIIDELPEINIDDNFTAFKNNLKLHESVLLITDNDVIEKKYEKYGVYCPGLWKIINIMSETGNRFKSELLQCGSKNVSVIINASD